MHFDNKSDEIDCVDEKSRKSSDIVVPTSVQVSVSRQCPNSFFVRRNAMLYHTEAEVTTTVKSLAEVGSERKRRFGSAGTKVAAVKR